MNTKRDTPGPQPRRHVSRFMRGLVFPALWILPQPAAHAQPMLQRELRVALDAHPHPEARVVACVMDISKGTTVFAENADIPPAPASSMTSRSMPGAMPP